jgi:hypothetical protein
MKLRITLALATLTLSAVTASAQQPAGDPTQRWRQPCAADIEKHCKEADKQNKTVECLASHEKDLTEECTTKFMNGYRVSQICKADFERLCKDVRPLGPCVKEHDAELSKECKAALVKGSKVAKAEEKAAAKAEEKPAEAPADKPAKSAKKSSKKK